MIASPFITLNAYIQRRHDSRGHLDVLYEQGDLVLKRSFSRAGVFRGMHLQSPPHQQTKLIRVASGRILDFIADPSEQPARLFRREIVPSDGWIQIDAHFAHGFYAIEDTEFEYLCLGSYNEKAELSFCIVDFLQSKLGLSELRLSAKDAAAAPLNVVDGSLQNESLN